MTTFRILGPVEATAEGVLLPIGGRTQLKLFAFLVLNANRAVSSDALIDAVWGSERSAADNRLQMAIARLRKALAPLSLDAESRIRTVSGGYLLSIQAGELDAELFSARVEDGGRALDGGDAARAAELLRSALELWRGRGPPFAELAFEDFAQGEIRRLEELRLAALETRIEADLALGRHAELISELERLHIEYPTRERFTEQLMVALYRCGRQADALDAYQRTRVELGDRLGLEPGPNLQERQAEILEHAPSLTWVDPEDLAPRPGPTEQPRRPVPKPVSAPLPSRVQPYGPSVFVDRRPEHDALAGALEQAASSGRRTAFVTGEPGIGKTRLVSEFASEAHVAGTLVLAGRCDVGMDLPYQPFAEALEHLVDGAPVELLQAHVARYGDSLSRLVPELAVRVAETPVIMPPASESERYVLFRAIEGLLAEASEAGPILLVIEDLHWAELPTLELLRRLLSSPRRSSLMLLCTSRLKELPEDHPLRDLLADVHRERDTLRIDLEGLAADAVGELVRGVTDDQVGTTDARLVTALETTTDGNPFFITELVRNLVEVGALANEDGRWQLSPDVEPDAHLPLSITETFAKRLRRMGEVVQRCLPVAAVVGEEFDVDLVSEVADCKSPADAVDEAVRGAVLIEVPAPSARFRFAHTLMQRYLYGELGAARRTELHRRVALAMEAALNEGRWPVAELAKHWFAAGDADVGKALRYAVLAGDEALRKLAPDDARRWYQISLDLLRRQVEPPESELCDLLVRRGEAERQAGDPEFRDTLLEAAGLAQRIGDDRGLVRAALANTRGMQSATGIVDQRRIDTFDEALIVLGEHDSPKRAQLLAMQAAELMYAPEWDRKVSLSDEALGIGRRLRDPEALSMVLNMRFVTLLAPDTYEERSANAVEAVAAAEQLTNPVARFFAYHWAGYACVEGGDIERARSWMAREREIAEQFRQPTALWLTLADDANLAIIAGKLDLADQLTAAALETGVDSEPDALVCYTAQRTAIAFEAGQLGELAPMLEQALIANPGVPGLRATLALALSEGSRPEEAQVILRQAAASNFSELPYDVTWLAVVCIYSHVSARLRQLDAAKTLYGLLEPWAEQIAFPAFGVWGPVSLYLGSLARVLGGNDNAERHLSAALRAATDAEAPLWQARATGQLRGLAEISE